MTSTSKIASRLLGNVHFPALGALLLSLSFGGCAGDGSALPGLDSVLSDSQHQAYAERQRERSKALNAPSQAPEKTFEQWMAEGDRFKATGNAARAYLAYKRAEKLDPENTLPSRRIAFLAIREEPAAARTIFSALLEAEPQDTELLYGLAFAELRSGRVAAARSALDLAVALEPNYSAAQKLLGVVCDRMNDREAAQHHYRKALEAQPNDVSTLNNLGVSLLLGEDYEPAARTLGKAVALGAEDPATVTNLGLALAFLGRNDAALAAFRRAGTPGDAYNNLAYVLALRGEKDSARAYYEKALLSNDTDEDRVIRNLLRLDSALDSPAEPTVAPAPAAPFASALGGEASAD